MLKLTLATAATALLVSSPTLAQGRVYGPPAPEAAKPFVYPKRFTVEVDESVEAAQAKHRYRSVRADATRWEIAYQVLNVVDTAQTIDCLDRRVCTELNPLFGKRPSKTKLIAGKAAFGLAHWLMFTRTRERDPYKARKIAQWSVAIQGGVVAANARFTF